MATNQLLPFGTAGGANVLNYASYNALASRLSGFVNGVADASQCNTAWRQGSFTSAMIGQFTVDYSGNDVLDDGNVATYEANFLLALKKSLGGYFPVVPTGNITLYVRSDGSDTNNGSANTAGGAFRTLQAASDYAHKTYGPSQYTITLQIGLDGTYVGFQILTGPALNITVTGATTSGTIISGSSAPSTTAVRVSGGGRVLTVQTCTISGGSLGLTALLGGSIYIGSGVVFGSVTTSQIQANLFGLVQANAAYSVSAGSVQHIRAADKGIVRISGQTVTLTGTPAFTNFVTADTLSEVATDGVTYSGSATGTRFSVTANSILYANGVTQPGSIAGTTATGGQAL